MPDTPGSHLRAGLGWMKRSLGRRESLMCPIHLVWDHTTQSPDCMTLAVPRVPTTTATHNHLLPHNPVSRPSHSHADSYDISGRRRSGRTNNIPVGPILRKPSDEFLRSGKSGKSGKPYRNSPGTRPGRGIENVPPVPSSL
ncbi:hypothetical protein DFH29DRAFT_1010496 [Suillus ampliporus]|nr:hypothetical protein DFH29DRAFT_1010496 [Suillus ampliporus]